MKSLGLYLHLPFCRSKCLYCDFCSFPRPDAGTVYAYAARLKKDLLAAAPGADGLAVDTVYFGGGTPTVLPPELLSELLSVIRENYRVTPDAEITLECNPATGSEESFHLLRAAGFNRLSIGLQSADEKELRALGRIHTYADFERTFADARRAGFENISADVMSGIPGQTRESYLRTLSRLVSLSPEHISAYGLIVEEGTPFFRMNEAGKLALPDEESARAMYFDGIDFLSRAGYGQYEISNFARAGYESRHNLKYWNCDEYLGFGVAAYSDFGGRRFGNARDLAAYLRGEEILAESETPSPSERENEYVMLRMRLSAGVSARAFRERFGEDFDARFGEKLRGYVKGGFVRDTGDGVAFTPNGMYVSNTILSDVLDFGS